MQIETKFNVGDTVYLLYKGKIICLKVFSFEAFYSAKSDNVYIRYDLEDFGDTDNFERVDENNLHRTPEELMQSVLEEFREKRSLRL